MRTLLKLLLLNLLLCGVCYAPPLKPFRGAVLPHGRASSRDLVLYLPLNEGSGKIVFDLSGNGNIGVITGAVWQPGIAGSALYFDGNADKVDLGSDLVDVSRDYTVILRIKAYGTGDADQELVEGLDSDNATGIRIQYDTIATGRIECFFGNGANLNDRMTSTLISPNIWTTVAVTQESTNAKLYIDAVLDDTQVVSTVNNTAVNWLLGQYGEGTVENFKGLFDFLLIYNRALTASEIAEHYRDSFKMSRIYWNWSVFGTISVVTDVYSGRGIGRGVGRGLVR